MFQFPPLPSVPYGFRNGCRGIPRGRSPHSEISGSKPVGGSPELIAACYVFHRRPAPKHPPSALIVLAARPPRLGSRGRRRPGNCDSPARADREGPPGQESLPHVPVPTCHGTRGVLRPPVYGCLMPLDSAPWRTPRDLAQGTIRGSALSRGPRLVEAMGFEPTTPGLQSRCSPAELRPRGRRRLAAPGGLR